LGNSYRRRRFSCGKGGKFFWSAESTMRIQLNGEPYEGPDAITVAQLLERLGIEQARVAVEVNLNILPKEEYATTALKEGDQLEVVHFIGGGAS
jgi:sulfur carrier protein